MKARNSAKNKSNARDERSIREGLLFIPDISGFTELVQSTDVLTGQEIIYELLSAVINHNVIDLELGEIEGDAVLFYRFGKVPSLYWLLKQFVIMKNAFDEKRLELEQRLSRSLELSLKVIAHYGAMTEFKIGGFKKLYGQVLIEAHRLLKNSIESDSYLLLTDSLLEIAGKMADDKLTRLGIGSNKLCEVYGSLRNICFSYFDFSKKSVFKQVA